MRVARQCKARTNDEANNQVILNSSNDPMLKPTRATKASAEADSVESDGDAVKTAEAACAHGVQCLLH